MGTNVANTPKTMLAIIAVEIRCFSMATSKGDASEMTGTTDVVYEVEVFILRVVLAFLSLYQESLN
jgi:hypothetical protein